MDSEEKPEVKRKTGRPRNLEPELVQLQEQVTTLSNKLDYLNARIDNLTTVIGKMAHYNGGMNPSILKEFDIPVFEPGRKEMHRHG